MEKQYGIPLAEGRRRYLETSGIPFFQQLEIIRPGGNKNGACAEEFESRKLEGFFDTAPSEMTIKGLEMLRDSGIGLVVSSNNFQHNVDAYVARHPLPVSLVLGFEHNGLEKGRPHFLRAQEHFNAKSSELLYCGDSLKDGERAASCSVVFIGKTGTFTREQFLEKFPGIETVETILELAENLVHLHPG